MNNYYRTTNSERVNRENRHMHSRPKSNSDINSIIRILVAFVIIVASIAVIVVIINRIKDIKVFDKIDLKPEVHDSLNLTTDANSGNSFFVNDEQGLKFRKEDKSFAREEWIEKNGELFYFDTAGYGLNGDMKLEGQVYTFVNGKLKDIKRDTSYVRRANDEYFSSIESAQYLVWLDDVEKEGNFYPIKYKMYSDDIEDYLGTEADKQYASPNMMKIYMSNIYYLAVGKGTNYAGRLYRMRPNAIHKETIGIGVTGFIVLSDDVVYYCDGDRVMKVKSWNNVNLKLKDNEELTEDGEIIIKLPTPSDATPLNGDSANDLTIDVNNLPKPDDEVRIEESSVNSVRINVLPISNESETSKRETSNREINNNNATTIRDDRNAPKVEIGLSPGEERSTTRNTQVEIGNAPRVVEVEAPR
ncbi:MAG: hypothetical protein J6M39_04890 [Lachnospiraceae bacterium]|nr:hypothetical protein [Lachnospiraceae bacterium]